MEPLFFIGIIVVFSILDSIARKRRTGMQPRPSPPDAAEERAAGRTDVAAYDADRSYDEIGIEEEEREETERARRGPKSSETLIPQDVWDEIAGLMTTARQSRTEKPTRASAPGRAARTAAPRPDSRSSPWRRAGGPGPVPAPAETSSQPPVSHGRADMPGARVHRSHSEYGTEPSKRSRSEQDGLDPLARSLGADEATARQQLRAHSRHALRSAVILHEVLGPPAALRPDRFVDQDRP